MERAAYSACPRANHAQKTEVIPLWLTALF
nr:MAG TPA: hypothetical protein [Caudoviricetes sp.]